MMGWVYILKSEKNGRFYIGSASDLTKRLSEHNRGQMRSSKPFLPYQLVFKQQFASYALAKKAEYRLKSYKRRDFIEKIIRDGVFINAPVAQMDRAQVS
jgi:putative endonuclease